MKIINKIKMQKGLVGLLIMVFLTLLILAAVSYRVYDGGAVVEIDEWSVCRDVDNDAGADIFVPTNTANEWTEFRTHYPAGVVVTTCAECTNPIQCSSLYPGCGELMDCIDGQCCTTEDPGPGCPPICPP